MKIRYCFWIMKHDRATLCKFEDTLMSVRWHFFQSFLWVGVTFVQACFTSFFAPTPQSFCCATVQKQCLVFFDQFKFLLFFPFFYHHYFIIDHLFFSFINRGLPTILSLCIFSPAPSGPSPSLKILWLTFESGQRIRSITVTSLYSGKWSLQQSLICD